MTEAVLRQWLETTNRRLKLVETCTDLHATGLQVAANGLSVHTEVIQRLQESQEILLQAVQRLDEGVAQVLRKLEGRGD